MNLNIMSVTPAQAFAVMKLCYETHEVCMLHGPRGIGKTTIMDDFATNVVGGPMHKILLTQIEAVDLKGLVIPDLVAGRTRWLPPEFLPFEDVPAVIGLDEINAAETRIQKSAYQLLLERRIGTYRVPDKVFVCAAGNTGDDGAIVTQLDAPAADRMVHLRLEVSVTEWIEWAQKNSIAPAIIAYIKIFTDHLEGIKMQLEQDNLLGPSPRGWARLSKFITAKNADRRYIEIAASGILGNAVSHSFMAIFDEVSSHNTIEQILNAPADKRAGLMPTSLVGLYNMCYAIAAMVSSTESLRKSLEVVSVINKVKAQGVSLMEIETLANELVLGKAHQLDLMKVVVGTPAFRDYMARRKAKGLE